MTLDGQTFDEKSVRIRMLVLAFISALGALHWAEKRMNLHESDRRALIFQNAINQLLDLGTDGERAILGLIQSGDDEIRWNASVSALHFAPSIALPLIRRMAERGNPLRQFQAERLIEQFANSALLEIVDSAHDYLPPPPLPIQQLVLPSEGVVLSDLDKGACHTTINDAELLGIMEDVILHRERVHGYYTDETFAALSPGLGWAYAIWRLAPEIENGGWLQCLWNMGARVIDTAHHGYTAIGAIEHARITGVVLEIAAREVDQHVRARDTGALENFANAYEWSEMPSLDSPFCTAENTEPVDPLIVAHVRAHPQVFVTA